MTNVRTFITNYEYTAYLYAYDVLLLLDMRAAPGPEPERAGELAAEFVRAARARVAQRVAQPRRRAARRHFDPLAPPDAARSAKPVEGVARLNLPAQRVAHSRAQLFMEINTVLYSTKIRLLYLKKYIRV